MPAIISGRMIAAFSLAATVNDSGHIIINSYIYS